MSNINEEISAFMDRCDDLANSKFIFADVKIPEILKSVAVSSELCSLFKAATEEFSYSRAKNEYMIAAPDGSTNKRALLIPEDYYEQLAFIFCLLADFDSGEINFNIFLQEFYYGDGSYTESFAAFVNQVIKPFKNAVKVALKNRNIDVNSLTKNNQDSQVTLLKELRSLIIRLRKSISKMKLEESDQYAIVAILNAMCDCIAKRDIKNFKALLFGYTFAESSLGLDTAELKQIVEFTARWKA